MDFGHHPTGVGYAIAQLMRELWFLQLDQYLFEDDAQANASFHKKQSLDIKVYRRIRAAFLDYFANPDEAYEETVKKLGKYVYGPNLDPVNSMSPTRALQMLWGYYAGSIPKGPNAEEHGFQSASPIRRLTAEVLKAALKRHFPVKINKNERTVNAMANANLCMFGLTNCIYHGTCKNVNVAARSEESRSILEFHAVKMCIIIDPTMVLADYALGNGAVTDDNLLQKTTVGRATYAGDYEALGWPRLMKWRHDANRPAGQVGMLPECSCYITFDRKSGCTSKMMVRPFTPLFDGADNISVITAIKNEVNRRFPIGHSLPEQFFGILVNTFPWLLNTRMETDLKFVKDSIEIMLMTWNIIKQIEDEEYLLKFTDRQRRYHAESYLWHYYTDESSFSNSTRVQVEETPELLTQLWTYYEPAAGALGPEQMQYTAPLIPTSIQYHDLDIPEFLSEVTPGAVIVDVEEE